MNKVTSIGPRSSLEKTVVSQLLEGFVSGLAEALLSLRPVAAPAVLPPPVPAAAPPVIPVSVEAAPTVISKPMSESPPRRRRRKEAVACQVLNCGDPAASLGFCRNHYQQHRYRLSREKQGKSVNQRVGGRRDSVAFKLPQEKVVEAILPRIRRKGSSVETEVTLIAPTPVAPTGAAAPVTVRLRSQARAPVNSAAPAGDTLFAGAQMLPRSESRPEFSLPVVAGDPAPVTQEASVKDVIFDRFRANMSTPPVEPEVPSIVSARTVFVAPPPSPRSPRRRFRS